MSTEQNKQIVRDTWACVNAGDIEGFFSRVADDVTWTFFGTHKFARRFNGKDDLIENLFHPLGDTLDGALTVHINNLIAEGDTVVMECKGESKTKSGVDYNNDYCIVIELDGGKIVRVREYLDTELVTAAFGK